MPMEAYTRLNLLGAGTFGKVYRATVNATGETVAIKKLHSRGERDGDREGMELSTLREIMLLAEMKHEHVIDLMEVFSHNGSVHMVLEICATDLEEVIKDAKKYVLDAARIKGYMLGTLRGLAWCHKSWVLHRDLKPANLFLTPGGVVKLGDFGLARFYGSPDRKYTGQVVTRWYRPPELLFGAKFYGAAVDMWSVGCIFAELMLRVPFFHGKSDIEQLSRIFTARGTPTEETWPGVSALPDYLAFEAQPGTPLRDVFTAATPQALGLLEAMLTLNPGERITAQAALEHPYFASDPPAAPFADLAPPPPPPSSASDAASKNNEPAAS